MRQTIWVMASLTVLAGCGGSAAPVGENSAGSIKTTAVGEVVANVATPTPTAAPTAEAANTAADDSVDAADAAANAM